MVSEQIFTTGGTAQATCKSASAEYAKQYRRRQVTPCHMPRNIHVVIAIT